MLESDRGRLHRGKQRSGLGLEGVLNDFRDALFLLLRSSFGLPILGPLALCGTLLIFLSALSGNNLLGLGLYPLALCVGDQLGDVGAVAAVTGDHNATIFGVLA